MSLFKSAAVCLVVFVVCGCDRGQPTPSARTSSAPTPDKQAKSAIADPYFVAMKKKAESGDATAQYNLGGMYQAGRGVPQDAAEAVKWTRLAADQGLAVAQENLGFMYRDGQGVPQDDVETYAWFSVAAGDRFPNAAKHRDLTASKLTPEQLSQGQKRATELFEKISGGK